MHFDQSSSNAPSPQDHPSEETQSAASAAARLVRSDDSLYWRLRLLVERVGDMVWTVDLEMRPTYASASLQRCLGYSPGEALHLQMEDIFHPESYQRAMQVLAEELARDRTPGCDVNRTRTMELDLLHKDGHVVPVEVCYSALRDADGNPVEIMAVARDITERRLRADTDRANTEKIVRALHQTVQALATLLEMRDSYTAGHQRRVAELACAIGRKLGLSQDAIKGLQVAGLIHDIGKVRVPAEILASTRALCAAEFEIIKMHPTIGYEVLKGIDFPWPIAETVYQHHERLDGSGYPRGLIGEAIMLEARILAVADVVEAIASDRPYRRPLGIEAALEQIGQHRNDLYDSSVVDACIDVFLEDDFVLGQEPLPVPSEDCP